MAVAVLGDIHSNLAALKAVLQKIDELGIKRILFTGDLIGYNASPAETIYLFRDRQFEGVCGNHDRYAIGQEMKDVRETTIEAVEYTRKAIGEDGLAFLRTLPTTKMVDQRYMLVHGSILDRDQYMLTAEIITANMQEMLQSYAGIDICFFGHSHFPAVIGKGRADMKFPETRTIRLDPTRQYMVNPGSVGQPRDGVPLASFAVFDPATYSITIMRIPYDVQDSHQRILKAGLGRNLAERLLVGR